MTPAPTCECGKPKCDRPSPIKNEDENDQHHLDFFCHGHPDAGAEGWMEEAKAAIKRFKDWFNDDPQQNDEIADKVLVDEIVSSLSKAEAKGYERGKGTPSCGFLPNGGVTMCLGLNCTFCDGYNETIKQSYDKGYEDGNRGE